MGERNVVTLLSPSSARNLSDLLVQGPVDRQQQEEEVKPPGASLAITVGGGPLVNREVGNSREPLAIQPAARAPPPPVRQR